MEPTIRISEERCVKCGLCGLECPEGLFSTTSAGTSVDGSRLCLYCGHCVAVCPKDAISHSGNPGRFSTFNPAEGFLPQQSFLLTKRSVRHFTQKEIEKQILSDLVKRGDQAPSAHNFRNRHYDIITDRNTIRRLLGIIVKKYKGYLRTLNPPTLFMISLFNKAYSIELCKLARSFEYAIRELERGNDLIFHDSKAIICVSAPSLSGFSRDDCIAAQHYMMLYAKTLGIESFIVGFAQYVHRSIEKALKLDRGLSIFAISAFGYSETVFKKGLLFPVKDIRWN